MIKYILPICIAILCFSSANAEEPKVNNRGEVVFLNWGAAGDDFAPLGNIAILGDAADAMWNALVNAKFKPAVLDLESRTPSEISRGDVQQRVGTHYICRNLPDFSVDGEALARDKDGNVIYHKECDMNIGDVKNGTLKTNK